MEIIKGSLDDISRPTSSKQSGSRVSSVSLPHPDRICPATPFSLVVLTNDAADVQSIYEETRKNFSSGDPDKGQYQVGVSVTDDEMGDVQLQEAIKEMRRLDQILSDMICKEKEVRRQRREVQAKLWQELLQNKPEGHSESAHEAMNTRLFLALEAPTGTEEEDDFVPFFETQAFDFEHNGNLNSEQSEKRPSSLTESFEVGHEDTGEEQFEGSHCGASKGKKKQRDFVKRNIELVSGEGDRVLLTQAERERLAELLQEVDGEEEDSARGADGEIFRRILQCCKAPEMFCGLRNLTQLSICTREDTRAVSVQTGHGYTPEPSDLEQLIHINSKIRLLPSVEEFLSVKSSCTNLSFSQAHGSNVGWKCDGDPQPGETVLQDTKERRGQERRLQEIQQQLEILGRGQEMTRSLETIELCLLLGASAELQPAELSLVPRTL
ncbi:fibrous sheath-interacting protein 1 isoform X3 [Acanthopagrus latus]|uniref:fibrous sheath-interacting protein 1 isoform X3 n=1 Tax=Acanthopagrus latus TaxID=8177 RepID=UPI00187C35D0|nr:fibrous sheath-interacting protein 1 isoform X3 [Acanthopagrus latus]